MARGAFALAPKPPLGTRPSARAPPPRALRDPPSEAALARRRGVVHVVAIQAQPRLEAQRIARAETRRSDAGLRKQQPGEAVRIGRTNRDLETVLARVTGARDEACGALERRSAGLHEFERRRLRGQTP